MKKLLIGIIAVTALVSCRNIHGSGNITRENRQTGNFTGIEVGSALEVEVVSGATNTVVVEADDNLLHYVRTTVKGGILEIHNKGGVSITNGHMKVFVSAPLLKMIRLTGASNLKTMDTLRGMEKFTAEVSGASKLVAQVDAPSVSLEATGAANIIINGRTRSLNVEATGSSSVKAEELLSESGKVHASGAASAKVFTSVSIRAKASGAATIRYRGGGIAEIEKSGAGNVIKE